MELNLQQIIENQVKCELEEMDLRAIIENEVRKNISKGAGKEIVETISSVSQDMISEEISKVFDGEVNTDDGWGKKESYPSFADLFKKTLKREMDNTYRVKNEIEKQVKTRVASLIKQDYAKVVTKIVDEISQTTLKKK